MQLPQASADALAASATLHQLISGEIQRQSGWISFARYMELVLYAPGLGYYSGGAAKLGKEGDFTTAPEITPLFGGAIARVVAGLMQQTGFQILEFGAGTGRLAFDVLTELQAMGIAVERYAIVEVSGELRARQEQTLRDFPEVTWLEQLPEAFSGVVLGNEVLDAMPVDLVVKTGDGWQERGVALAPDGSFRFCDQPCGAVLHRQIPEQESLPPGYLTETHAVAAAFMRSLGAMIAAGHAQSGRGCAALLIDYGFPAHEYYHPQRSQGTLMCHYRHHAHPDPFYLPGLQDVTAHVDFSAMAQAAIDGGLDVLGYTSQAAFLIDAGIGDLLVRTPAEDAKRYLPQANAMQKLMSPAEMGELFKVLVTGKHVALPEHFHRNDRSYRL
ncbi:class I SAM-dependent methyltransferase [Noviherbaspirillum saxi]|uniref:Class I SAM-dependent methyltransferase n=1 Tax=Noviherbaspirillum saxi TaxID=2320863 RepID=A0A3A3FVC7_9BURK|nr:class I SAM-dependent methyltransferase [Noviherbaspirillum saxi]